ncbi:CotG/ExsB N-terminal domain-containing protein [Neobacillus niacini]|uniref:CotG/ExsB N-terminal domain-containing protein n=1 Tax=Neobacillus niacini TaxID=86668 RepID=UPI003B588945
MSDLFNNEIQRAVDSANSMGLSDFMFQSPSSCRSRSRRRTSRRFTSRRRTSRRRFTSRRRTSRRRFCRNWDDLMFGNRRRCGFRRF